MMRAIESVLPPGAKGTTILIGLTGHVGACANAMPGKQANKQLTSTPARRHCDGASCKDGFTVWTSKNFMALSSQLKINETD
jgi:hypothetical protein